MPLKATVLFDTPQCEIASQIAGKLASSVRTEIVAGFATVEGVAALKTGICRNPAALHTFVVGAGTYRAFDAFDQLIADGVPKDRLFVHLGHARMTTSAKARHRFYRYHPMLHSKVYYTEHGDGSASAFIGSHNVTGFALKGLNGEAAILLEGDRSSPEFEKIRRHIASARTEALTYSPTMKGALSWWSRQFFQGLAEKANDAPREGESKKTIVVLCEAHGNSLPKRKELLYFELRAALGTVKSLSSEVHLFVFDKLPASPMDGLNNLDQARASFWCKPVGLEMRKGGVELLAHWHFADDRHPVLAQTPKPFRPKPSPDMQQVRVEVYGEVRDKFDYLFEAPPAGWIPVLDEERQVQAPEDFQNTMEALKIIPPEHLPWSLVRTLEPAERDMEEGYFKALQEMSPEAGSYILMSLRRNIRDD
jgi:hypothetical protein